MNMAKIQIKRGLQEAVARLELAEGELAVALDTGNVYVGTTSGKVHINPTGGTADTAERRNAPGVLRGRGRPRRRRSTSTAPPDVRLQLVLAALSGLKAGTYTKVTVNNKGQVTAGQTLEVSDIPSIPSSKITGLGTAAAANTGAEEGNVPVVQAGREAAGLPAARPGPAPMCPSPPPSTASP